jgi:hypothetical protein
MTLGSYTPKQRMEAIAAAEAQLDREGHKPSTNDALSLSTRKKKPKSIGGITPTTTWI